MDEHEEKTLMKTSGTRKTLTTFPFSKTTCVCNCGKYNLQDLPLLRKILPEDYEYKLCEYLPLDRDDKFLVTLRMTLTTKEEALEWKRIFEEKSLTTHVKDKTFPKVGRVSVFKAQYRCQFFDRRKNKKKLPEKSKFRDCHSILFINIKKYFKNTVDRHMPTYRTVVRLHYAHDHPLDTADVLKKRQLNEDIKQRFLEMFRQGMKPKDALDKHKRELLQKLGAEKYRQVVCDGYYVPNVPKAYRLYYQIHGKGVSAKTTTKRSSRHNPNPDWIAFQNCPDTTVPREEGESNDMTRDDGEDDDVGDDDNDTEVENENVEMEDEEIESDITCQNILDQPNHQSDIGPDLSIREGIPSHSLGVSHSVAHKPLMDNIITAHSMVQHDGQLQKLADTAIAYPNIAAHNSVYTDMRNQNLAPPHNMPVPSFPDPHVGMGLFNPAQPTWENFGMTHQQAMTSHLQPQHSLGFQSMAHQNPAASYMILSNSDCQNTNTHYVTSHGMIDHDLGLQNTMTRTTSDLSIIGSNTTAQHAWSQNRPLQNMNVSQVLSTPSNVRCGKVTPPKRTIQNQIVRKSVIKKSVQKKRKSSKELNMKHVTKRWMDKKPKVEAETQNLASEVLQNILLSDESEKLKVKLLTFLSDLESKMTSNPKLFVPAIRCFLQAGEIAQDDNELASFLKDFGKTEDNVLRKFQAQKFEATNTRSSQTRLSGSVVRVSRFKSTQGTSNGSRSMDKSTSAKNQSCIIPRRKESVQKTKVGAGKKFKASSSNTIQSQLLSKPKTSEETSNHLVNNHKNNPVTNEEISSLSVNNSCLSKTKRKSDLSTSSKHLRKSNKKSSKQRKTGPRKQKEKLSFQNGKSVEGTISTDTLLLQEKCSPKFHKKSCDVDIHQNQQSDNNIVMETPVIK